MFACLPLMIEAEHNNLAEFLDISAGFSSQPVSHENKISLDEASNQSSYVATLAGAENYTRPEDEQLAQGRGALPGAMNVLGREL